MNLPDIVKRNDRSLEIVAGELIHGISRLDGRRDRTITLAPGTRFILKNAHEFTFLKDFPRDIGWRVLGLDDAGGGLVVSLVQEGRSPLPLSTTTSVPAGSESTVFMQWPVEAAWAGYDLLFEHTGSQPTVISVGPLADPRAKFAPFLTGRGVEVGPGLNPYVMPSVADVDYVEEKHPSVWQATYAGRSATLDKLTPEILERYRVGSAVTLDGWEDDSLDFIFSNHVFEHLPNPLQVLVNWFSKLRPGGVILGATPDARGCFDLRQPLSEPADFLRQYLRGGFEIEDEAYLRWCRYTEPSATVENLKARNYSVHTHFYTPASFSALARLLSDEGRANELFLEAIPNNKDFGFILRKPVTG